MSKQVDEVTAAFTDLLILNTGDGSTVEVTVSDVIEAIKRPTPGTIVLAKLVADMRHCQTEYFRTRSSSALEDSKRKERQVDAACQAILDGQKRMF